MIRTLQELRVAVDSARAEMVATERMISELDASISRNESEIEEDREMQPMMGCDLGRPRVMRRTPDYSGPDRAMRDDLADDLRILRDDLLTRESELAARPTTMAGYIDRLRGIEALGRMFGADMSESLARAEAEWELDESGRTEGEKR